MSVLAKLGGQESPSARPFAIKGKKGVWRISQEERGQNAYAGLAALAAA
jgi:hypothetical protein